MRWAIFSCSGRAAGPAAAPARAAGAGEQYAGAPGEQHAGAPAPVVSTSGVRLSKQARPAVARACPLHSLSTWGASTWSPGS
eukprot:296969-Pyramimonas_sp.AAC.1